MKKRIKAFSLIITVIVVFLVLYGCTSHKDISGTYLSEVVVKDLLSDEEIESFTDVGMDFYTEIPMQFVFVLNSNNTFLLSVDIEDFKNKVNKGIEDNTGKLIEKQFKENGILPEQYDLAAQNAGYKDYKDMEQKLLEQMKKAGEDELNKGELDIKVEGNYIVRGDEITFTVKDGETYIDEGILRSDGTFVVPTVFSDSKEAVPVEFQRINQ